MKNENVESEINREIDIVRSYVREISNIFNKDDSEIWINRDRLDDLEDSALNILKFVYHVEALKQVRNLSNQYYKKEI